MNLPDGLLTGAWTLAAWLLFIPIFLHVVRLSGMVLTRFVIYRPQWVSTFEDSRYLRD